MGQPEKAKAILEEIKNSSLQILSFNRGGVFYCGKRNDIYNFLLSNRLQGQWIDIDTLYDSITPPLQIITDRDIYKITSRSKQSLNLEIGMTKDKQIYFRIPSSVEINELEQPFLSRRMKTK
jgi:hypothetical protein